MAEKLCEILNLNIKAGLGWRLAALEICSDPKDPNIFYLCPPGNQNDIEARSVSIALGVRAQALHLNAMRFLVSY